MTEALAAWAAEAQLVGRGVLRSPDVVANAGRVVCGAAELGQRAPARPQAPLVRRGYWLVT
jgi:glutamate dehydrogenase/leucine dehydrogenase